MTVATKLLDPRNPTTRETQISRCLAVQIQIEMLYHETCSFLVTLSHSSRLLGESLLETQKVCSSRSKESAHYIMRVSPEIARPAKSTKSRNSSLSVSRGTNSNWDVVSRKECSSRSNESAQYIIRVSPEIARPPKSTKSTNSSFSVSRGTYSNWMLVSFECVPKKLSFWIWRISEV